MSVQGIAGPSLQQKLPTTGLSLPKARLANYTHPTNSVERPGVQVAANGEVTAKLVGDFLSTAADQPQNLQEMRDLYYDRPNHANQRLFPVLAGGKEVEVTGHEKVAGPMQSFFEYLDDEGVGKRLSLDTDYDYRPGRTMRAVADGKLSGVELPKGTRLPSLTANGLQFKVDGSAEDLKRMSAEAQGFGFSTRDYSDKGYMLLTPIPEEVYSAKTAQQGGLDGGVIRHMINMSN